MSKLDWEKTFTAPFRGEFLATIRSLPFSRLRTQPPPKRSGLPFANELRVVTRYGRGQNLTFQASGLAPLFRLRLTEDERLTFDGLVVGLALQDAQWRALLGQARFTEWERHGLFIEGPDGGKRAAFRIALIGNLVLVYDPPETRFTNRVHAGGDSIMMSEFLDTVDFPKTGRVLDVGTGSGVILLFCAQRGHFDDVVGVDINPRAVMVARLNAELNGVRVKRIDEQNIFDATGNLGRFDLVTWNTPLKFFPESFREKNVDGFGGHMGIELGLRFLEVLPKLLRERGKAYVAMLGPVLRDRSRVLDDEAAARAAKLGLDIAVRIQQGSWDPQLRDFHEQFQITHFEVSFLEVSIGKGAVRRIESGPLVRVGDGGRWLLHQARKAGWLRTPPRPPLE
jgi:SAM-dependent methyltransferase